MSETWRQSDGPSTGNNNNSIWSAETALTWQVETYQSPWFQTYMNYPSDQVRHTFHTASQPTVKWPPKYCLLRRAAQSNRPFSVSQSGKLSISSVSVASCGFLCGQSGCHCHLEVQWSHGRTMQCHTLTQLWGRCDTDNRYKGNDLEPTWDLPVALTVTCCFIDPTGYLLPELGKNWTLVTLVAWTHEV